MILLLIDGILESMEFPWFPVSIVVLSPKFTEHFETMHLYLLYSNE